MIIYNTNNWEVAVLSKALIKESEDKISKSFIK